MCSASCSEQFNRSARDFFPKPYNTEFVIHEAFYHHVLVIHFLLVQHIFLSMFQDIELSW